jgi:hypothetical protein
MAIEGPNYPEHPPLARPGWWRERRIWLGVAAVVLAVIVVAVLARTLPRESGDTAASGPGGTSSAQANTTTSPGSGGG